jgi:hypothetical protein
MRYAIHVLADSATSGKLPIHGPDFVAISVQQQLQIRMRTLKAQIAYFVRRDCPTRAVREKAILQSSSTPQRGF